MKLFLRYVAGFGLAAASSAAVAGPEPSLPVVSTLVSLVLVLAAIGAAAFLFRRIGALGATQSQLMRVVGQLPLGAREKISIVELDDQWLVLGVTSQQITLLTQTARKDAMAAPPQAINFSKLFDQIRGKHDKA